jgi:cytochrome c
MKKHRISMLALLGNVVIVPALAKDDGQAAFNNTCRMCHTMKKGDNRLGPSLAGIIGRKAGALPGYNYSSSMRQSGIIWDAASLDQFIADPDKVVHGNNMKPYGGLKDAARRKAIVEFLKSGG